MPNSQIKRLSFSVSPDMSPETKKEVLELWDQSKDIDSCGDLEIWTNIRSHCTYLVDEDFRCWMLNPDGEIEEWYFCPECGTEGFIEDYETSAQDCCIEYLRDCGGDLKPFLILSDAEDLFVSGGYLDGLRDDPIAIREEWNNYTDALCKGGEITPKQYDTWEIPEFFVVEGVRHYTGED